jgi:hypothetical protein
MKRWSSLLAMSGLFLLGCVEGAKLVQETDSGGIVVYPYKGELGPATSPFRPDAIQLIERRCRKGYQILREGETKGRNRVIESAGGIPEVVAERRWGIQFSCKEP